MTSAEVAAFVERLGRGKVDFDEFRTFTAADWEAVKGLLLDRKDASLKRHVDAVHRFRVRMRSRSRSVLLPRTYSEAEIVAEMERPG